MQIHSVNRYIALPLAITAIMLGYANAVEVNSSPVVLTPGNSDVVTWQPPASPAYGVLSKDGSYKTRPYKIYVWVSADSTATNAIYRVYPNGKSLTSDACLSTDASTPCFEIPVDTTKHLGEWVQLTLAGDPATYWDLTFTFAKVTVSASDLGASETLTTGSVRFESPKIGQAYQGGVIISLLPGGMHGLIAANQDLPGKYDFNAAQKAVKDSSKYDAEGQKYSDWRVPTSDELNIVFQHKDLVGATSPYYWSSSSSTSAYAWLQIFTYPGYPSINGYQGADGTKSYPTSVHPVRSF